MRTGTIGALSTFACVLLGAAAVPSGAQEKVGVVTTVVGPVTVTRASLPPEPLKFKDDVFLRDRVTTGDAAFTRILVGGKVIITARERSTLTITETPDLSTIHLTSGRIAVAVDKPRMKPNERVEIRTPNAVAGVRGTVLIVEAEPDISTITVLRGLVHVTRLHSAPGERPGVFTPVGALQAVTVRRDVLPARPQSVTPEHAAELSRQFAPPLQAVASPTIVPDEDQLERARVLARSETMGAFDALERPLPAAPLTPVVGATAPAEAPALSSAPITTPTTPPPTVVSAPPAPPATKSTSTKYSGSSKYDKYSSKPTSGKR